jgi:branched-chain amino acid aminotransferase
MWFYRDGEISEQATAPFDLSDRGLLLGDGVFDTAMVLGGRIFRAGAHLERLLAAARALGIDADRGALTRAAEGLAARGGQGILRTTVTRGPGPRGLRPQSPQHPTILASVAPLPAQVAFAPVTLAISAIRRNESSPTSRLKTLSYLDAVLAAGAAAAAGFDEALFLNCAGRVACAASGNIFAVHGREIVTPPVADGVLPGIIRAFVLAECGGVERALDLAELLAADAVFVTSSVKLIAPVTRIGGATLQSDRNQVVTELQTRLRAAISAECGVTLPPPGCGKAETLG